MYVSWIVDQDAGSSRLEAADDAGDNGRIKGCDEARKDIDADNDTNDARPRRRNVGR